MFSLRSIRSRLPRHDRYLDPFPDDVETSFEALLDALDSEQQHVKVAALKALFRRGLAPSVSTQGQVDFGHRILLFLMKIKGRVVDSRVDEVFIRSFMRAVGKKKRKEAELQMEQERIQKLLDEEDEASEDGRWWRKAMSYSSDDELSNWSESGSIVYSDGDDEAGEARMQTTLADNPTELDVNQSDDMNMRAYSSGWDQHTRQRPSLPLLREPTSRSSVLLDIRQRTKNGRGHPYSDPRSLAVWIATKSNPVATHLSECLNPRQCLTVESFITQMLNCVMGCEQPGPMVHCGDSNDNLASRPCEVRAMYSIVPGVHLEGVSMSTAASVGGDLLKVANALKHAEHNLHSLPQPVASAVARQIQACRSLCLAARPQSLPGLMHACCAVRHRARLLKAAVTYMASIADGNDYPDMETCDGTECQKDVHHARKCVIEGLIDELELVCSSGTMATSVGVLLELVAAGDHVPDTLRLEIRRACREYMDAIVVAGETSLKSKSLASSAPETRPMSRLTRRMEWWHDEYHEMAQYASLSHFKSPPSAPWLEVPSLPTPSFDVGLRTTPGMHHYRMMEDSSKDALRAYRSGVPFGSYTSMLSIKRSVLGKIDDMFDVGASGSTAPTASSGARCRDDNMLHFLPLIYPLPPSLKLKAMLKASAPRLEAPQLAELVNQLNAVKGACFMPFPYDTLESDLRPHVESIWATEDLNEGKSSLTHHISFFAPLSDMLGPEAQQALSAARGAVLSLHKAWEMAVEARCESLKAARALNAPCTLSSSSRAEHLRDLARIVDLRDKAQAVDFAFWEFSREAASVISLGGDATHVVEMINACFVELGRCACRILIPSL